MSYLIDTCVVSVLRRASSHPDPQLEQWIMARLESELHLSVLTVGEIQQGIDGLPKGRNRRLLEEWFLQSLLPRFEGRILQVDKRVALKWGELSGAGRRTGRPLPVVDGLIAATALVHDLIVVTANIKDFSAIPDIKLVDPWE